MPSNQHPNSLENSLIDRIRRCWNKRQHSTGARANTKDAIFELRTYRTNREINPQLHQQLDTEAMKCFHSGGLLGYTEKNWDTYCYIKNQLTRIRFDEPKQETLIQGLPLTTEKPKGRVRMHPPKERITQDYFDSTITEIENGTLTPYLPVREMLGFIVDSRAKKQFLMRVRTLAFKQKDHELHGKDYKRIYRVASRALNELHNASTQLDFFDTLPTA